MFSKLTIIVRPQTVTFAWAPWRWPRSSYPLAGLRAVRVIDTIPAKVRNRRRPSARVFDCGRGPAIELELGNGRRVFATVDDPEAASNAIRTAAGLP